MDLARTIYGLAFGLVLALNASVSGQDLEPPTKVGAVPRAEEKGASATGVGFAGKWNSSYGVLTLTESQAGKFTGTYEGGALEGKLDGGKLKFRYEERSVAGEGWFELAEDRQSFSGKWKADPSNVWLPWVGSRAEDKPFDGLWQTTYGSMRLSNEGGKVSGSYVFQGIESTLAGEVRGRQLHFTYHEPGLKTKGEGVFTLEASGDRFSGKWRAEKQQSWASWTGQYVPMRTNRTWLIVLEAHWEERLQEPEYNFGEMLKSYFKMPVAKHVSFRHRFFHDLEDLQRFTRELKYFDAPIVLVISTHGTPKGISVFGDTIDARELASCLSGVAGLKMLHLSGCAMMASSFPHQLQQRLKGCNPAITGYKTYVDWDTSALSDFLFLTLVLIRDHDPIAAVQQAIKQAPFLGDGPRSGAFVPLGLSGIAPR